MSKIILKLSIYLIVTISSLGFVAQAFGQQRQPNASLRGFHEGCEQANHVCWYGVMVNETRVSDAWTILEGRNYFLASSLSNEASKRSLENPDLDCGTYFIYEYRTVNGMIVKCRNLRLGDWLNTFGMPDAIGQYHDVLYYQGDVTMRVKITGALRPDAPVVEFMFPVPRPYRENQYNWQGFAPRWRYCQLNVDNPC